MRWRLVLYTIKELILIDKKKLKNYFKVNKEMSNRLKFSNKKIKTQSTKSIWQYKKLIISLINEITYR